ncbi:uncharacterized protein TNIN_323461 [Trichonephila inaurata madagascariensis]|uniref:Uncharacterized protein n=1 Tax=Trichonephila inaurata madagascariensis TaxID=2747483 RepID=A0A8X6YPR2_9ARAC|nr:uncharacterized protein TNIN_323461 [Trichonephila inaurata madagascariensis]
MELKWLIFSFIATFCITASRIVCATVCDEAKQWLKDNREGMKNVTDVWIQLRPWVSGNQANCLRSLLNETKDDESLVKLNEVLKRDVFKDVVAMNCTKPGKKKKPCPSRRPQRNRRLNQKKNRKPGTVGQNVTKRGNV